MGKKSLDPWIAECVWSELAAVISWQHESKIGGIKRDPDSRFHDDGSNFRSWVTATEAYLVQLIDVLSVSHSASATATVLLSDGATKVKAHLSTDAVAVLEAETGEKFSGDVTGDVFRVSTFTVISTPFGPVDGFIQLEVDAIEYEHHLRRQQGEPKPVAEDDNIKLLLDDITKLRCPRLPDETEHAVADSTKLTPAVNGRDVHQAASGASDSRSTPQVPDTQPSYIASGIQSQYPLARTRTTGPTLASEGFEVAQGLNLHQPVKAPSALGETGAKLLDLFRKKGTRAPSPDSHGVERQHENTVAMSRDVEINGSPRVISETPAKFSRAFEQLHSHPEPVPEPVPDLGLEGELPQQHHSQQIRPVPTTSGPVPPSAQPTLVASAMRSSGYSRTTHIPYGRRKIPADQKKLLDDKSSWLPSLPGRRFPHPNVPIALLKKWNERRNSLLQEADPCGSRDVGDAAPLSTPQQGHVEHKTSRSSASSVNASEDSEELLEWSPSPPQHRPELPPDSSWESAVQGTQQSDLQVAVPRTLPVRKSPSRHTDPGVGLLLVKRALSPIAKHVVPPRPPVRPSSQSVRNDFDSRRKKRRRSSPLVVSSSDMSQPWSVEATSQAILHRFEPRKEIRHPASPSTVSSSCIDYQPGSMQARHSYNNDTTGRRHISRADELRDVRTRSDTPPQTSPPVSSAPVIRQTQTVSPGPRTLHKETIRKSAPQATSLGSSSSDPFSAGSKALAAKKSKQILSQAYHDIAQARETKRPRTSALVAVSPTADKSHRMLTGPSQVHIPSRQREETQTSPKVSPPSVSSQSTPQNHKTPMAAAYEPSAAPLFRSSNDGLARPPISGSPSTTPRGMRFSSGSVPASAFRDPSMVGRNSSESSPTVLNSRALAHSMTQGTQRVLQSSPHAQRQATCPKPQTGGAEAQQHPDEQNRVARREHFGHSTKRQKWIQENYRPNSGGTTSLSAVFAQYVSNHAEDSHVNMELFTRAAQMAFGDTRLPVAILAYSRRSEQPTPSPAVGDQVQSRATARSRHDAKLSYRSAAPEAEHMMQRSEAEPEQSQDTGNIIREFCQNWKNIKPGGAFANPQVTRPKASRRQTVDVLAWNV